MAPDSWKRRLALALRKTPLLIPLGYKLWRVFQPRYTAGAVGVLFNQKGEVLLVEHAFHPETPWGLPGGWVGRNENPAETVRRELHEELALHVEIQDVLLVDLPFDNHLDVAYLCHSEGEVGALSYELLDYAWFPPDQMPYILKFHYLAVQKALSFRLVNSG